MRVVPLPSAPRRWAGAAAGLLLTLLVGGLCAPACAPSNSSEASLDSTGVADTTAESAAAPEAGSATAAPTPDELRSDEERSVAEKLDDARIEARVKRALMQKDRLRPLPLQATVISGRLVLQGDVTTPDQYRQAERVAGQVDGVADVTNRLTLDGQPVTEERLAALDESADDAAETDEGTVYHTVQPGDTLWEIARQYKASVAQIRDLNGFRSPNLQPGDRIRVR